MRNHDPFRGQWGFMANRLLGFASTFFLILLLENKAPADCYMFQYDAGEDGYCVPQSSVTVTYYETSPCAMSVIADFTMPNYGCIANLYMACDQSEICTPPAIPEGDTDFDSIPYNAYLVAGIVCDCDEYDGIVSEARIWFSKPNGYANCTCVGSGTGSCSAYDWFEQGICD